MTACPADGVLHRFLSDALPAADARAVEQHLDGCADCRRRLDRLADVTAVGSALAQAADWDPTPAPGLARAIERLEQEATSGTAAGGPAGPVMPQPDLPPTDRPGFIGRLGGIEIRRVIGRGGMGVVYEGLDPALDRQVAVKVLSAHLLGDGAAAERFLREARAAAALADDHVVTIHAIDQADGVPFLVLQHVAGESLAELLAREGRLPVDAVARIGAQVARGLAAAHARALVHRDVKPANILLEQGTGVARLTDFGLAKLAGRTSITGAGMLAGTPSYMSPEQAAGRELDGRSDLFSLGVVLYAAAAGRPPFGGDSPFVILDLIRTQAPTPLAQVDPTLPAWFCAVVDRLLEKDLARRIQSAAEVVNLLERRTDRPAGPRPAAYWLAGAAAVVVLAGVIGLASYLSRPAPADTPPDTPAPAAAAPVPPGFVLVGRPDYFPTLGDAVNAAGPEDVIEVHGDGPHRERRVEIVGKKLTVRAAAGFRPRIQPAAPGQLADAKWLNSDTDLILEGLDILWPVPGGKLKDPSNPPATLGGLRGRLTLRKCRIVCGKQAGCILTGVSELTVEQCHLVAEGGVAIWWHASPGGKMRVTGSVLEGEGTTLISFQPPGPGPNPDPAVVEFTHNTLVGKGAWGFVYRAVPSYGLRFDARRNLVSVTNLFGLPTLTDAADIPATLRSLVGWTERDNVYSRGCSYLVALKPIKGDKFTKGELRVLPTSLTSLPAWLNFWMAKDTGSVEGDIRFHPRAAADLPVPLRLVDPVKATGTVPTPVGAGELPFK